MSKPAVITFVTGNANKLREVQQILGLEGAGQYLTNKKVDLEEVQGTVDEVTIAKTRKAAETVSMILRFW